MDFHAVVVVGIEITPEQIEALAPQQYAEFLGVDTEAVREAWAEEDDCDLATQNPFSLRIFYVEDMVDLCFGGETKALAIPLADFLFEFRDNKNFPYYVNRRLAFSKDELDLAFNQAAQHLYFAFSELRVPDSDIRLFTPVTYSPT